MLAELAAANAAYATISKFIVNGKEISDALAPLKNLVGAEEGLKARGNCKRTACFPRSWVSQLMTLMNFWRFNKYQRSAGSWKACAACTQSPALGINLSLKKAKCASSESKKPRRGNAK